MMIVSDLIKGQRGHAMNAFAADRAHMWPNSCQHRAIEGGNSLLLRAARQSRRKLGDQHLTLFVHRDPFGQCLRAQRSRYISTCTDTDHAHNTHIHTTHKTHTHTYDTLHKVQHCILMRQEMGGRKLTSPQLPGFGSLWFCCSERVTVGAVFRVHERSHAHAGV